MIYLDTPVVVWLYAGDLARISRTAREALEAEDDLRICPMVELELCLLHEIGRLHSDPATLLRRLHADLSLTRCDAAWSRVVHAAAGLTWTRDPFDRLIVAHALAMKAPLLSSDGTIAAHYPRTRW